MVFTTESLQGAHRRKWGGSSEEVAVYRAPGRVVLRGGAAMAALDVACYVTRSRNASGELRVISENLSEERRWPLSALPVVQPMGDWSDLVVGAAKELFRAGYGVEPANLRVHSGVPVGAAPNNALRRAWGMWSFRKSADKLSGAEGAINTTLRCLDSLRPG